MQKHERHRQQTRQQDRSDDQKGQKRQRLRDERTVQSNAWWEYQRDLAKERCHEGEGQDKHRCYAIVLPGRKAVFRAGSLISGPEAPLHNMK